MTAAEGIGDELLEVLQGDLFHPVLIKSCPGAEGIENFFVEHVQAQELAAVPVGDPCSLDERVPAVHGVVDSDDDRFGCFHGSGGV